MSSIVPADSAPRKRYRVRIPEQHKASIDTRLQWLWRQKFGTVQLVHQNTEDVLDKTATTLLLQAIIAKDLASIEILFNRLEGGPVVDTDAADQLLKI